jgi:hypothetical protein
MLYTERQGFVHQRKRHSKRMPAANGIAISHYTRAHPTLPQAQAQHAPWENTNPTAHVPPHQLSCNRLLDLLLGSQLRCPPARLFAAVHSPRVHAGIALAANHLVLVIFACQDEQRRLDNSTTQAQDQVQRALLLDVVVRKGAAVLKLLAGEDQSLLIRRDALLVLNFSFHIFCSQLLRGR